jgi:hypothetical protein
MADVKWIYLLVVVFAWHSIESKADVDDGGRVVFPDSAEK